MIEYKIYKIRISSGWKIIKNTFYELDYYQLNRVSENLIYLQNEVLNLHIELDWFFYRSPGTLRLRLYSEDYHQPQESIETNNPLEIINVIEKWVNIQNVLNLESIALYSGWEVKVNNFYELDKENEEMKQIYLSDNLLTLNKNYSQESIQLSWEPKHSKLGVYRITYIKNNDKIWIDSSDKNIINEYIEKIMRNDVLDEGFIVVENKLKKINDSKCYITAGY